MIIHSTTLDTEAKVKNIYGGTSWIQHSGYVLRGDTTNVVANSNSKTGGNDSVSYTPAGSNSGMGITMNTASLSHSGGAVQNHTLTVDQMPAHTHGTKLVPTTTESQDNWGLTTSMPGFGKRLKVGSNTGDASTSTGGGKAHSHGFTQPNAHSYTPSVKSYTNPTFKGTAATINTLPQYKSVYIWERVS